MRAEKNQLVQDIAAMLQSSNSFILIHYKGMSVGAFGELRAGLEKVGSECHVVPNRLFKHAAKAAGIDLLEDVSLTGDTALVTPGEDVVGTAKVVKNFAREEEGASFKLSVVDGSLCTAEETATIADLPSKEVLQAQLLGLLQAPAGQLVRVLNASVASIVYVLSAYQHDKENAA